MGSGKARRPIVPLERINVPKGGKWKERGPGPGGEGGRKAARPAPKAGVAKAKQDREEARLARLGQRRQRIKAAAAQQPKKPVKAANAPALGAGLGKGAITVAKAAPKILRKLLSLALIGIASSLVLGVVTAAFIYAYLYFSESDYFMIKRFDIRGISKVSRAQVLSASGLDRPVNTLTFDTVRAVRSLKSLPWVEDAEISRTPPPDGVTIRVKEYKPRAIVNLEQLYFLDEEGRPFKNLEPGENPDFPIVSGFSLDELLNGGPLVKRSVGEVFELMAILGAQDDDFRLDNVSEIRFDPDIGITLFMAKGGLEVRVGFGPYGEKLRRLAKVIEGLESQGLADGLIYVNLECAPRVTAKYLPGKSPRDKEPKNPAPMEENPALAGSDVLASLD
ncbi:MAG: FtsQ-type POTRA domain-containing protein [Deltaproteobacteria bacterium]|jgi:cell division protein FtsQ|nr:FtsQ-type POTRA domain-containing protein [Deltaproteobacteria bacterium]